MRVTKALIFSLFAALVFDTAVFATCVTLLRDIRAEDAPLKNEFVSSAHTELDLQAMAPLTIYSNGQRGIRVCKLKDWMGRTPTKVTKTLPSSESADGWSPILVMIVGENGRYRLYCDGPVGSKFAVYDDEKDDHLENVADTLEILGVSALIFAVSLAVVMCLALVWWRHHWRIDGTHAIAQYMENR